MGLWGKRSASGKVQKEVTILNNSAYTPVRRQCSFAQPTNTGQKSGSRKMGNRSMEGASWAS